MDTLRRPLSTAIALLLTLFLLSIGSAPVRADSASDCFSEDIERRISGCTALIEEGDKGGGVDLSLAYAMRALAYSLKGQYETAIQDYDTAIGMRPDFAVALNNRAWAYYKWGRGAEGLSDVEQSLRLNPLSEHTWDTRGHIRQKLGNHDGALTDYQQAMILGGSRMVKIYQCGLSANGLYRGRIDGIYSDELRDALKMCADSTTCDPLPADEECKDPVS